MFEMEWLNLIPFPVAVGLVLYVRMQITEQEKKCSVEIKIKEHAENCPVGEILSLVQERQVKIDEKLDKVLFLMVKNK